jgi:hypothetical protein
MDSHGVLLTQRVQTQRRVPLDAKFQSAEMMVACTIFIRFLWKHYTLLQ